MNATNKGASEPRARERVDEIREPDGNYYWNRVVKASYK